jgi:hypothetical protein
MGCHHQQVKEELSMINCQLLIVNGKKIFNKKFLEVQKPFFKKVSGRRRQKHEEVIYE